MNNQSVLFIGNIQNHHNPDGGGIQFRNQVTLRYLGKYTSVKIVDTWNKPHVISLCLSLFYIILNRKRTVVLSIGIKAVYTLILILSALRIKTIKTIYFMPGGDSKSKSEYLTPHRINVLNKIDTIYEQSLTLTNKLRGMGLTNIYQCNNYKEVNEIQNHLKYMDCEEDEVKFVFIGRLIKEKGIENILEASKRLFEEGITNFSVTFYGKQTKEFNEAFFIGLSKYNISFKGFLNMSEDDAYMELQANNVLLFPTYFSGEGFPGVLIDAFISGLGIIATDHNMNGEIIKDSVNGILIEKKSTEALYKAMRLLIENKDILNKLRRNAYACAQKYDVKTVLDPIFS